MECVCLFLWIAKEAGEFLFACAINAVVCTRDNHCLHRDAPESKINKANKTIPHLQIKSFEMPELSLQFGNLINFLLFLAISSLLFILEDLISLLAVCPQSLVNWQTLQTLIRLL